MSRMTDLEYRRNRMNEAYIQSAKLTLASVVMLASFTASTYHFLYTLLAFKAHSYNFDLKNATSTVEQACLRLYLGEFASDSYVTTANKTLNQLTGLALFSSSNQCAVNTPLTIISNNCAGAYFWTSAVNGTSLYNSIAQSLISAEKTDGSSCTIGLDILSMLATCTLLVATPIVINKAYTAGKRALDARTVHNDALRETLLTDDEEQRQLTDADPDQEGVELSVITR
ncbi:MAG: hypothetical protein P1U40_04625 [Coxiellaceae bacterium]|nr:hypothetical protein [Coxiellaceae bacterium]